MAVSWDPPGDPGGGRWGGLHGLNGQMEEKQFPVRSRGEQRQQRLCLHSFLELVAFLAASSTNSDWAYSDTTLGPRPECKILKSQTDALIIMPSFFSKDRFSFGLAILKEKKKTLLHQISDVEHYAKDLTLSKPVLRWQDTTRQRCYYLVHTSAEINFRKQSSSYFKPILILQLQYKNPNTLFHSSQLISNLRTNKFSIDVWGIIPVLEGESFVPAAWHYEPLLRFV